VSPRSLISIYSDGRLSIAFGNLRDPQSQKAKERLWKAVREDLGWEIANRDFERFPHLPIEVWMPKLDDFLSLLSEIVGGAPK
jgi:hypothetical protein